MSAEFGTFLADLLSDMYDPSDFSPTKFKDHWNALIREKERLREVLKEKDSELQMLEHGIQFADSHRSGKLSDGDSHLESTTSDQTKEALGASNEDRKKHVRDLVGDIRKQGTAFDEVMEQISTQRRRLEQTQKQPNTKKGQRAGVTEDVEDIWGLGLKILEQKQEVMSNNGGPWSERDMDVSLGSLR